MQNFSFPELFGFNRLDNPIKIHIMKTLIFKPIVLLIIIAGVSLVSCELDVNNIDKEPAESAVGMIDNYAKIFLMVDDGLIEDSATTGAKLAEQEYTETVIGDYPNKILRWDFGTGMGDYQGILNIHLTDDYKNENAKATITFEEFVFKGDSIKGELTLHNRGTNLKGRDQLDFRLKDGQIGMEMLDFDWQLVRVNGSETPESSDDMFEISEAGTGPAMGVDAEGTAYDLSIVSALLIDLSCEHYVTSGIIDIILANGNMLGLDFGDGKCDNAVSVSNGVMKVEIFL